MRKDCMGAITSEEATISLLRFLAAAIIDLVYLGFRVNGVEVNASCAACVETCLYSVGGGLSSSAPWAAAVSSLS